MKQEFKEHLSQLERHAKTPITVMEVCGTHTMAIARSGLKALLPRNIRLISGPGCPVCVSPVGYIDHALAIAKERNVIVTTFGDLMRVPGSMQDEGQEMAPTLTRERARGADIRVVYSALDALDVARRNPDKRVVFLGVGFETTAPTIAAAVLAAKTQGIRNFLVLSGLKTIPNALAMLAASRDPKIDGLLCPGHVSVITGLSTYESLVHEHGMPCAVAGFEPVEILRGLASLVAQIEENNPRVDNCYPGAVREQGNPKAKEVTSRVFHPVDSVWRGLGEIPLSGLELNDDFHTRDATRHIEVKLVPPIEPPGCRCGDVLRGAIEPRQCALFGTLCTPEAPRGACMVSSEGSCAASFRYQTGENT